MKKALIIIQLLFIFIGCQKTKKEDLIQGKIEKEQIAVVSKIPGKILKLFVKEGDIVQKGDVVVNTGTMPLMRKHRTNMLKITVID